MTTIKLSDIHTLYIRDEGSVTIGCEDREVKRYASVRLTRDETHALYEALHVRYTSVSVPYDPITPVSHSSAVQCAVEEWRKEIRSPCGTDGNQGV